MRAIFLDRDGVINRAFIRDGRSYSPASLDDFAILPGVPEALTALHHANFRLIIVTNQPDVGNGLQPLEVVEAMHRQLRRALPLDQIRTASRSLHPSLEAAASVFGASPFRVLRAVTAPRAR